MKIHIEKVGLDKSHVVQKIFESSPEYFRRVDKSEVLPHFAVREMTDAVPKGRQSENYEKIFCLIYVNDEPIGIVDLHKNHPSKNKCYIGLFVVHGHWQKKGYGKLLNTHIENFIAKELGCSELLLGVSESNDVEGFWESVGFRRNGHSYLWNSEDCEQQVFEMAKMIN